MRHLSFLAAMTGAMFIALPFTGRAEVEEIERSNSNDISEPPEVEQTSTEDDPEENLAETPHDRGIHGPADPLDEISPAAAEDDPRLRTAEAHIARGEVLHDMGDFSGALVEFQHVHEILEGHALQHMASYNIGRCYERLYRYDQAMVHYRRFVEDGQPSPQERVSVEARIAALEELLATVHLQINTNEYVVWVDEHDLGEGQRAVLIPGGNHVIEIRAPGFLHSRQEVNLAAQTEQTVIFDLEELAEEYLGLHRGYFWASTALTIASVTVAAIFGGLALAEHNEVEDRLDDEVWRWSLSQTDLNRIDTLAMTSDIFIGSAALFGVAALILAFFTNWNGGEDPNDDVSTRPFVDRGMFGLGLGGSLL